MKLASEIREALEDINAADVFALGEGFEVIDELIATKLEPMREARDKIRTCAGFVRRECLTCDEAGACVVELDAALDQLSEEE